MVPVHLILLSSLSFLFFFRFNDEVKHIKVIEKDSWIHITEAKKFESLLVRASISNPPYVNSNQMLTLLCCCVTSGVGGVLPGPLAERELQAVRHHTALPLQVQRTLANAGQHALTR